MSYKAEEKFIEDVKDHKTLFTKNEALKATLSSTSHHKRFMKMNIDSLKLAIDKINQTNNINNEIER